jgi:hypothetical protein
MEGEFAISVTVRYNGVGLSKDKITFRYCFKIVLA